MTRPRSIRNIATLAALVASVATAAGQVLAPSAPAASQPRIELKQNGIAAIVEGKVITMDEVQEELYKLLQPQLQQYQAATPQQQQALVNSMVDDIMQEFINRELAIKKFRTVKQGESPRTIPESYIDGTITRMIADQFDNDHSKYVRWLTDRRLTRSEHRREVEEDIIYQYMVSQMRKSVAMVSPLDIETYYQEHPEEFRQPDRVHMRMIQLNREPGETDEGLKGRLAALAARVRGGEKFHDLAAASTQDAAGRAKGGDWDWVTRDRLDDRFVEPLFSLKKGEVTEPILMKNSVVDAGFILYAEDREYEGIVSLDKARPTIERILVNQMASVDMQREFEKLRKSGYYKLIYTAE